MRSQEFSVRADYDEAANVVEILIRCSPNLIRPGMDIAAMQVQEVIPKEGAIAPPLEPPPVAPPVAMAETIGPDLHNSIDMDFIDANWRAQSSGPVLPNTRGF